MRKPILLVCLVALTAVAGDPGPKSRDVGRFRLLRTALTYATDRSKIEVNTVLKIDSMTGETWILKAGMSGKDVAEYWSHLENNQARQRAGTVGPWTEFQTNR